jgi:cell division protein FtsB
MPTRLKRPSVWRQLGITAILVAVQGYLGFNVVSGQFGIDSQRHMHVEIGELKAKSAALAAEIDAYRHRASLFSPQRLDPDIVSERARALLAVAQTDDIIVMVDETSGEPVSSSSEELASDQLIGLIQAGID